MVVFIRVWMDRSSHCRSRYYTALNFTNEEELRNERRRSWAELGGAGPSFPPRRTCYMIECRDVWQEILAGRLRTHRFGIDQAQAHTHASSASRRPAPTSCCWLSPDFRREIQHTFVSVALFAVLLPLNSLCTTPSAGHTYIINVVRRSHLPA
jgi:hypothetical protein